METETETKGNPINWGPVEYLPLHVTTESKACASHRFLLLLLALPCTWLTNARSLLRRLHGGDGHRPGQPRRVPEAPRCQPPGLPQDHCTRPRCAQPPHQSLCMKPAALQRAMGRTPCVLYSFFFPSVRHTSFILFQSNTHTYIADRVLGNRMGNGGNLAVHVCPSRHAILVVHTAQFQTRALSAMPAVQTRRHGLRRNIAAPICFAPNQIEFASFGVNPAPSLAANRSG